MSYETPAGVSDYLPHDAKALTKQMETVQRVFSEAGFSPIKTPTIEFSDSLEMGLGPVLKQHCIEFFDPSGKRLMLRPDNTTPIARSVAARMKDHELPLKLSYVEPVFRRSKPDQQGDTEIFQAGCEWIGYEEISDVAELIAVAIMSLKALGYTDIGVEIGHVDFTKGLDETKKQALLKGDYLAYGGIPERGKRNIAKGHAGLETIFDSLEQKGFSENVFINKGLVKGLYYYTGTIFELYLKKSREVVVSGGQYDELCGRFGYDQPAVGFAINLNHLNKELHV